MRFSRRAPAVLAAAVAVSVVLPGGRFVRAQSPAACTADNEGTVCASNAACAVDYGGAGINYCVCADGYYGDGLPTADGNTGCSDVLECSDATLNDCIAVSTANAKDDADAAMDICQELGGSYECNCPVGTVGSTAGSALENAEGGDGKTLASGGSGCPAAISAGSDADGYDDEAACLAVCVSPDGSCFLDYLDKTGGKYFCACKDGYKGDATERREDAGGCTRLAPVLGEEQTLGTATQKIITATGLLTTYIADKTTYEAKQCQYQETVDACTAATALHAEKLAEKNRLTFEYNQAVNFKEQKDADLTAAQALDETAADRTRLESAAQQAVTDATTAVTDAFTAKTAADTAEDEASTAKDNVCHDTDENCADGVAMCVGKAEDEKDDAFTTYSDAKGAAEGDNLIPEILTPEITADANPLYDPFDHFIYSDSDGDLIPDKHDACPTQMGLRRPRRAQGNKDSSSEGGVGYTLGEDVWKNFNDPGPQDFCPSGCPETDESGVILDTDGDGFNDCEDRCPFVAGIAYNHAWTQDAVLSDLDRNLDYNGCPDFGEFSLFVFFFLLFLHLFLVVASNNQSVLVSLPLFPQTMTASPTCSTSAPAASGTKRMTSVPPPLSTTIPRAAAATLAVPILGTTLPPVSRLIPTSMACRIASTAVPVPTPPLGNSIQMLPTSPRPMAAPTSIWTVCPTTWITVPSTPDAMSLHTNGSWNFPRPIRLEMVNLTSNLLMLTVR